MYLCLFEYFFYCIESFEYWWLTCLFNYWTKWLLHIIYLFIYLFIFVVFFKYFLFIRLSSCFFYCIETSDFVDELHIYETHFYKVKVKVNKIKVKEPDQIMIKTLVERTMVRRFREHVADIILVIISIIFENFIFSKKRSITSISY